MHTTLAYNNKFDDGGCNYRTCRLATYDDLLGRLEELVGRLAIREAMAEVVSRSIAAVSRSICRCKF